MRRRTKTENVEDGRFVITLPAVVQKTAFRLPALRHGLAAVLRPLPVDTAVEGVRHVANIRFSPSAVEISSGGQYSRHQQCRVDQGQLALPDALPGLHVQEVVVKALEAGRVRLFALRTIVEKPQRLQRQRRRHLARHPAVFDRNGIAGQRKADHRDAARRTVARCIGDKPVFGIDVCSIK